MPMQVRSSWGFTLARALAREASRSFLVDLHRAGCSCQHVHVEAV